MCSTRPSVSTRTWRFLPLISLPASKPCGSTPGPFFCALHALAVHDTGGWTGFTLGLLTAFHIQSVMHLLQRAVPAPLTEVAVHRTARWQVLGDVAPLAAGA